ncbi:siderophore-interacting protein [Spongisporangium articulatum]|uniref:Siderophore-interacting protein n=1 Tax=Spongisporangium articulatum TaxID=3362603 RepID=A0ABW8AMW8_9ACTN
MPTHLTVTSTEDVTPGLRRVWFRSDDLSAFAGSEHTDRYVKLMFPVADQDRPVVRTYTALFPNVAAGTLAIDFVVHGDQGTAGPWAARAQPGDTLLANGPGGAYSPDPAADWHLLAGDESALPAITAALAVLSPTAVARVVVLVDDAAHEPALDDRPDDAKVVFLHRESGDDLVEAVRALDWLPGRVQAFVHGEAQAVMHGIRPYLLKERGLPRADVSISGYWRQGRTEEGFREWKSDLAKAEEAGPVGRLLRRR